MCSVDPHRSIIIFYQILSVIGSNKNITTKKNKTERKGKSVESQKRKRKAINFRNYCFVTFSLLFLLLLSRSFSVSATQLLTLFILVFSFTFFCIFIHFKAICLVSGDEKNISIYNTTNNNDHQTRRRERIFCEGIKCIFSVLDHSAMT